MEIRSLISLEHLDLFLSALIGRLKSHRDFEAVQAVLNVFLTVHADVLIANGGGSGAGDDILGQGQGEGEVNLQGKLEELREVQRKEGGRLSELVGYAMGTLGFLRTFG
jgi:U3 small nucleolar RNA-associated protein 21